MGRKGKRKNAPFGKTFDFLSPKPGFIEMLQLMSDNLLFTIPSDLRIVSFKDRLHVSCTIMQ